MSEWLECLVSPEQFTGEYSVCGKLFNGSEFSLFAPERDVRPLEDVTTEKPVKGWIHVLPGNVKDDLILVTLPQATFENGQTISVRTSQLGTPPSDIVKS